MKRLMGTIMGLSLVAGSAAAQLAPAVDHHQHLFSPAMAALLTTDSVKFEPLTARDLIPLLDSAGIRRAVLLSTAYLYGSPRHKVEDEYTKVRAENDWTAAQAAECDYRGGPGDLARSRRPGGAAHTPGGRGPDTLWI